MNLSDLPIEILTRVLPIEDYLIDLPTEIIVPWLNLLPQVKLYRIIGDSGYGANLDKEFWPLRLTVSGKTLNKYGQSFETAKACVAKMNDKLRYRVFIKAGHYVEAKYYKKYVIFDIEAVGHLVQEYYKLLFKLHLWPGNDRLFVYLWCHYCDWDLSTDGKNATFIHHSKFRYDYVLTKLAKIWFTGDKVLMSIAKKSAQRHFELIENLELSMSVDEFMEMKTHYSFLSKSLRPKELRIYLNLVENSVGGVVSTKCPADFPTEWVTGLFEISKVQVFALHYFNPGTTVNDLGLLLYKMPNVIELDLSFGKLDFEKVARLLPFKNIDSHIQVKVDKNFFETYQFTHIRHVWRIDIQDTFVVVGYIKRAIVYESTTKPLTLVQCLGTWFRYLWERNHNKLISGKKSVKQLLSENRFKLNLS